jgi:hypothetical protein
MEVSWIFRIHTAVKSIGYKISHIEKMKDNTKVEQPIQFLKIPECKWNYQNKNESDEAMNIMGDIQFQ